MAASPPPPRGSPAPRASPPQGRNFKPTSFEDQVRYAYHTPSPGTYLPNVQEKGNGKQLGKISEARIPSALDHGSREKALVPGPGSYETPDLRDIALPEGGRLSRKPPQERIKLDEYPSPPPGTYGIPVDPTLPRQLYGSFGKDPRVTKFIQDQINLSKGVPAPGAHDVMDSMENVRPFCPEGGRYLDQPGRTHGYFDEAAKLAEGKPAPGRYNMPGAINQKKNQGKLVWRYQSESLAETKKVIERVVGTGKENPAPGAYTLPDPKPLAPSPTLKGRQLSHGMPHPYAYNCEPDHAGKFSALAHPVRDGNNGAQIFGRDFKKGAMTPDDTKRRADRAKAVADQVAAAGMPLTLAEREIEQPGETVQWRSGGFANLRKAKSSPVISKAEHPAMQEMQKHFPPLSKFHGRHDKTFIPNASRRPEIVKTHSKCPEYQCLQRKKWEIGAIAAQITAGSQAILEPLDEAMLREKATQGLMDKARFRMRMEGLAQEQQDLVLAELPAVLMESTSASNSPRDGFPGGFMGMDEDPFGGPSEFDGVPPAFS